jgi:integrase/recombinase XerD
MKLSALVAQYVAYKQSMGMRFHTEARTLRSFCRAMGEISVTEIAPGRVQAYIAGTGPVTRFWHRKHEVLRGFYRFAMARGYAASSPLPKIIPKPPHFVPYIFSHENLLNNTGRAAFLPGGPANLRSFPGMCNTDKLAADFG